MFFVHHESLCCDWWIVVIWCKVLWFLLNLVFSMYVVEMKFEKFKIHQNFIGSDFNFPKNHMPFQRLSLSKKEFYNATLLMLWCLQSVWATDHANFCVLILSHLFPRFVLHVWLMISLFLFDFLFPSSLINFGFHFFFLIQCLTQFSRVKLKFFFFFLLELSNPQVFRCGTFPMKNWQQPTKQTTNKQTT